MKSVPVSPQARTALGIDAGVIALSPDELISAILAAPVDLLWNGGIGTYVKASSESHADVGDRSNDAVRIDATRLRARVVGEGGNLGFTQAARIEYSLGGGLMNTDFIDNSAGVDTSDHEVNIKILLADAIRDGAIPAVRPAQAAERDDRRGGRPGAAAQLRAEHGAGRGPVPGPVPAPRARAVPAQADQGQAAQPGAGRAARRAGDRRAPVRRAAA